MLIGLTANYYFHVYGIFFFSRMKILFVVVHSRYERECIHEEKTKNQLICFTSHQMCMMSLMKECIKALVINYS